MRHSLAGALLLRSSTFAGASRDPAAWGVSLLVVGAVALSHGLGAVLRAPSQGYAEPASLTFLFGFLGEILLWAGSSATIVAGSRLSPGRRASFGALARPLGLAAAPGLGVVLAGALSGSGRLWIPLLVVMGAWRLVASYVAVREGLVAPPARTAAWLAVGLVGGLGLMAAGTAALHRLGSN